VSDDGDSFDPDEFFASHRSTLGRTNPFIQSVLNAHLDIEAHLGEFLELFVFHPAELEYAGLRYINKVYLARAFDQFGRDRPDWRAMIELNAIRNKIVHRKYREGLTVKLTKLRDILREYGTDEFKVAVRTCGPTDLIVNASLICTGYLAHLIDDVKEMKGREVSDDE
jgi:hypothetical protein